MKTPKEKAKEFFLKYSCYFHGIDENVKFDVVIHDDAKQCALIAVQEILDEYWQHDIKRRDWWQEVKQEIENYETNTTRNKSIL